MNRVDRLYAIVTVLQSKRVVRAEDLAARFNISIRTVYRDIRALEEGGIPIGAEAGIGYFLTEGFHLPPVMFTHQEARALLLAGKLLEKQTDLSTMEYFTSAITTVRAVLDTEKKDELEGLEQKILVNPFPSAKPSVGDLRLDEVKEALANNYVIKLNYYAFGTGEATEREVEPIGICYYYSSWHLIAYCRLRKDYRDFRLDRATGLKVLSERFLRIRHPDITEYMEKTMRETELTTIVIKTPIKVLRFMQESKYTMGLLSEHAEGDRATLTFASYSLEYFARWLLMYGSSVEVISPPELQEKIKMLVRDLGEKYLNATNY